MTLDEAIEHARWCAENTCGECAEEHMQLAGWLRELKALRGEGGGRVNEPQPCFVCGALPKVDSFLLMDLRHRGWTALCPNKHYETDVYYDREGAVEEWNLWVENEGWIPDDEDEDDAEVDG